MPRHTVFARGLLRGRAAIVTGGGSGIGKAISAELLSLGCSVLIASRTRERLEAAAAALAPVCADGARIAFTTVDNRVESKVRAMAQCALREFGRLDYLVNNGGGQFPSATADISQKGWETVLRLNLTGPWLCAKHAYREWMQEHGGAIVSVVADFWQGFPGMAHTGAARAGVHNMTKTLAVEWADSGVRINAVAPGVVFSTSAAANYDDPELLTGVTHRIPAQRLASVEEVSGCVTFLLSPAASYVTGETMKIDGGASIYGPMQFEVPDHKNWPVYGGWQEGDPSTFKPVVEEGCGSGRDSSWSEKGGFGRAKDTGREKRGEEPPPKSRL